MVANRLPGGARMGELAQAVADLLAAAHDRLERRQVVRQREEELLDLLVHARGQQAERLEARRLRAEVRVVRVGGERRVHRAGHLAEPAEAAEKAVGLLGQLVQGQLPAVGRLRDELLEDPERRLQRRADVRVPPAERRNVLEAVLGEEAEHLQVRVRPRLEAAEGLQEERRRRRRPSCSTARRRSGAPRSAPSRGRRTPRRARRRRSRRRAVRCGLPVRIRWTSSRATAGSARPSSVSPETSW